MSRLSTSEESSTTRIPAYHIAPENSKERIRTRPPRSQSPPLCISDPRVWIGEDADLLEFPLLYTRSYSRKIERKLALSLLAQVLLAAPSIALDWTSMSLLSDCLEFAWLSHAEVNINNAHSPRPWVTRTLTLSGDATYKPWKLLQNPHGFAFLASISHLTSKAAPWGRYTDTPHGQEVRSYWPQSDPHKPWKDPFYLVPSLNFPSDHCLPSWMKNIVWASFKSIQTVSLAYPHIIHSESFDKDKLITTGMPLHVEVLMLPASLLRGPSDSIPWEIKRFAGTCPGEEYHLKDWQKAPTDILDRHQLISQLSIYHQPKVLDHQGTNAKTHLTSYIFAFVFPKSCMIASKISPSPSPSGISRETYI
ncbi:hypothetical protein EDB19DRAFT_2026951 [Suillus lakei]|nr:hypothetical protein EDB19DRAFT_2026951 [Suillus lakei]